MAIEKTLKPNYPISPIISRMLRLLICLLICLLAKNALAEGTRKMVRIEGPLEFACPGDNPVMDLIVEITIPDLFNRKEYRFPLKHSDPPAPPQIDDTGSFVGTRHSCGGIYSENGDSMDLSKYYGGTASISLIQADSAQIRLSYYWKTPKGQDKFSSYLTVPLFSTKAFKFRHGIVVKSHPRNRSD
jgi:hypothetical protein